VRDPVVIFEVLRPSTSTTDRLVKAREYQATPSVQRYVMLEQDTVAATVHVRSQEGWSVLVLKHDDDLGMPEIGVTLPLAELYEGLNFDSEIIEGNEIDTPPTPSA
jgi:Uma2 family endonuclease